jgi:hypothetical protein
MQHHFEEVLNDADAQVIFEPYDDDYKVDGVLEIQVFGEHHSYARTRHEAARTSLCVRRHRRRAHACARRRSHSAAPVSRTSLALAHDSAVLHEMTDKLVELDLDIIRATVHASNQPGHHHDHHEALHREDSADGLTSSAKSEPPQRRSFNEMVVGWASSTNLTAKKSEKRGSESSTMASPNGQAHAKSHKVGREVFYVKENTTGSQYVTPERRWEIEQALHQVLDSHGLHGIIIVRMTHESEMNLAQKVPALAGQNSSLSIHVYAPHQPAHAPATRAHRTHACPPCAPATRLDAPRLEQGAGARGCSKGL